MAEWHGIAGQRSMVHPSVLAHYVSWGLPRLATLSPHWLNGGQPWDTVVRDEMAEELNSTTASPRQREGALVYLPFDILTKDLDRNTSPNPPRLEIYDNDSSSFVYRGAFA